MILLLLACASDPPPATPPSEPAAPAPRPAGGEPEDVVRICRILARCESKACGSEQRAAQLRAEPMATAWGDAMKEKLAGAQNFEPVAQELAKKIQTDGQMGDLDCALVYALWISPP